MQVVSPYYIHIPDGPPPFYEGTIQYRDQTGINQQITAARFHELTGAVYTRISFPTKGFAENVALTRNRTLTSLIYPSATDETLRLVHMEGENASIGFGVIAARVIKRYTEFCRYSGKMCREDEYGSDYQLSSVDAQHYRGLGAMINHSFPNACFISAKHSSGIEEWVAVALDPIPEDEPVCINYGDEYEGVTLGKHIELRYDAMRTFVQNTHIYNDYSADFKNQDKWHYLACNPSALLELYFNGDWSWEKQREFLSAVAVCMKLPQWFETIRTWLTVGIEASDASLQSLRMSDPKLYKEISDYFRQAGRTRSCLGAVYAIYKMASNLSLLQENWPELRDKLDPYIDAWEYIFNNRSLCEFFDDNSPRAYAINNILKDPCLKNFNLC